MFTDLTPESLANTIGWAVSTWFDRPGHIRSDAAAGHGAGLLVGQAPPAAYEDLYLRAYERRRGHRFAG